MGMEMSMGMGVRDGGDAMTKGWALLILARKLCFDFVSLALSPFLPLFPLSSVCVCVVLFETNSLMLLPLLLLLLLLLLGLLRFCVFRVPLLLGPRQLFW